jgi:hypothetical protein
MRAWNFAFAMTRKSDASCGSSKGMPPAVST